MCNALFFSMLCNCGAIAVLPMCERQPFVCQKTASCHAKKLHSCCFVIRHVFTQLPHADSKQMKPSSFANDMDSATAPCRLHPAPPPRFLIVINMTQNGWQATHPLMPGKVLTGTLSAFLTQRKASTQLLSKYKFIHKNKTTTIAFNWVCKLNCVKTISLIILPSDGRHDFNCVSHLRSLPGCKVT